MIGRQFTLTIVQRASGLDAWALAEAVDELSRLGILRPQGSDSYNFSHDKLRAAAYAGLSPYRRQLLQRRAAAALHETPAS